jgi:hypothetical protein
VLSGGLDDRIPHLELLYCDLHEHPELSFQEERTAPVLAARLVSAGLEVTTGVGKTGVTGVLRTAGAHGAAAAHPPLRVPRRVHGRGRQPAARHDPRRARIDPAAPWTRS